MSSDNIETTSPLPLEIRSTNKSAGGFTAILVAIGLLACIPSLLAFGARWWWPLDLLTHFRVHYIWLLTPLALWLAARRRFLVASILMACLGLNILLVAPVWLPQGSTVSDGKAVRLLSANVLTSNRDFNPFLRVVHDVAPDIVLLMEIDQAWTKAADELRVTYPFSIWEPRQDNFGIALLSKYPIRSSQVVQLGRSSIPSIHAILDVQGVDVHVVGTHPLPPIGRAAYTRNSHLAAASELVSNLDGPTIVVGDLNVTPWSPFFRDFLSRSQLRDSRLGSGNHASWPSHFGWGGIPIDHILVSEEIDVRNRAVAAPIGSDHRPIYADLRINQTD